MQIRLAELAPIVNDGVLAPQGLASIVVPVLLEGHLTDF